MNKKVFFIIAAVIIFYAVNNFIWLSLNKPPSAEDEFVHLVTSLSYYVYLFRPDLKHLIEIYRHSFWPPVYYITGAVFSFLSSPDYRSTVLFTNLFYFVILLFSIYLTGKILSNTRSGIFSLLLISLSPVIYGFSRIFMLELALTSIVALGIYIVVSFNKSYSSKKFIYLFIVFLIGALVKWSFFVFLFPLLCSLYFNMSKKAKNKYLLLLFSGLSTIIIIWYAPHIKEFLFKAKVYILRMEGGTLTFSNYFREILFYLKTIVFYYCSLPLFILFLFPFIYVFFFRKFQLKYSFLLTIIFPILFMSMLKPHNGRHLIPLLVPMSLIAGYGLDIFWEKRTKSLFLLMFGCSFINFFLISYIPLGAKYKFLGYAPRKIRADDSFLLSCAAPKQENWRYKEIIKTIEKYNKKKRFDLPVEYALFSRDKVRYADFSIAYFDIVKKLKGSKNIRHFFLPAKSPKRSDFLIIISEDKDWINGLYCSFLNRTNQLLIEEDFDKLLKDRDKFEFVDKIDLSNGKTAYIYAQKLGILENKFAYTIVNHKGAYFFLKDDLKNKYKIGFIIVDNPSVIMSSKIDGCDYMKVALDEIKGQFYWYDSPCKLNFGIVRSNDGFEFNIELSGEEKEIFMILFPIEKETEQLKYASLKNSIRNSLYPLTIYNNNIFSIFENRMVRQNQPGFLIDIPGAICLNGIKSAELCIKFFKNKLDFENYWQHIERLNAINVISK